MSGNFKFTNRKGNERIERDQQGNTLKKYGGTNTSWPTHSKVQMFKESHKSQQNALKYVKKNLSTFFKNSDK